MGYSNLVIGYHGCDATLAAELVNGKTALPKSKRQFEWLGHGMYFWENNLERAREWAQQKRNRGKINQPAVIGAMLDLKNCCDFTDKYYLDMYQQYFLQIQRECAINNIRLPDNFAPLGTVHKDKVCRTLDCTIMERMHEAMFKLHVSGTSEVNSFDTRPFDSVRGVFLEGLPVFEGSDIYRDTHIQICIRNPECIVGFFLPREDGLGIGTGMEVREEPALFG